MTNNINHQEPLKSLREHGIAIVTKGERTGRFVKLIRESSYTNRKITWSVEYLKNKHGDDIYPRFSEDMLVSVASQFEPAVLPDNGDKCILIGDCGLVDNWRMIVISVQPRLEVIAEEGCEYYEPGNMK